MAAFQHFAKHPVRVIATFVGALGVLVVDPSQHDHFAGQVVTKKQAVLLEKLGAKPVFVVAAKGVALPIFGARRVLWNHLKRELDDRCQPLAGVFLGVVAWVFLFKCFNLLCERFNLGQEQGMSEDRPAIHRKLRDYRGGQ